MRKYTMLLFLFVLMKITYCKITIEIFEPIRFLEISTRDFIGDRVVGVGTLEISTDDLERDRDKKLVFNFPKKGLMTNRKKWIEIDEYKLETKDNNFIIKKKVEQVKIYAIVSKRDLDKGESSEIIEGDYAGYVPIIISQYSNFIQRGR